MKNVKNENKSGIESEKWDVGSGEWEMRTVKNERCEKCGKQGTENVRNGNCEK